MTNAVFTAYQQRDRVLLGMGFDSYKAYQRSSLWKSIRERQLMNQPWCTGCGGKAWQVHHLRYDKPTMMGRCSGNLVSVCGTCHFSCEFDVLGSKLSMDEANRRLLEFLRNSPEASRKNAFNAKVAKRRGTSVNNAPPAGHQANYSIKPHTRCWICKHEQLTYLRDPSRYAGPWRRFTTTRSLHFGHPVLCVGNTYYFVEGVLMMRLTIRKICSEHNAHEGAARLPEIKPKKPSDYRPKQRIRRDSEK